MIHPTLLSCVSHALSHGRVRGANAPQDLGGQEPKASGWVSTKNNPRRRYTTCTVAQPLLLRDRRRCGQNELCLLITRCEVQNANRIPN